MNWVELNADEAIRRKLVDLKYEAVDWPANTPGILARQVTPQYRLKARLQGSDIGFKIVSLFTGKSLKKRLKVITLFIGMFDIYN